MSSTVDYRRFDIFLRLDLIWEHPDRKYSFSNLQIKYQYRFFNAIFPLCLNLKKARIECMHSTRYRTREWSNRRFLAYLKVIWHANFFCLQIIPISKHCTCMYLSCAQCGASSSFFLYHIKFSNVNRKFSNFQYFLPL